MNLDKAEAFEKELRATEDHSYTPDSFLKPRLKSVEVQCLNTLENLGVQIA